jgi:hypothetical protein
MNTNISKINDFLSSSVKLIDDADVNREINNAQLKYSAKLFQQDLEINDLECQIDNFNKKTDNINSSINNKVTELKHIQESLSKFN